MDRFLAFRALKTVLLLLVVGHLEDLTVEGILMHALIVGVVGWDGHHPFIVVRSDELGNNLDLLHCLRWE